jgi:hypothetical protein
VIRRRQHVPLKNSAMANLTEVQLSKLKQLGGL